MKRLCCLVLGFALAYTVFGASFSAPHPKFIGHGWDLLAVTPEEVLKHADQFDKTALDGVTLMINDRLADGRVISHSRIMNDPPWPRDLLQGKIKTFRAITAHPSLKESFISSWWAPRKRLKWTDDAAWANFATNMGTVAWLAKQGGLRGILVDAEDYPRTRQYFRAPDDPPYAEAARLARQRGREVFSAIFREYPDITFLSFWMLSFNKINLMSIEPIRAAEAIQDLWPWFVNGMLDVIPPNASFVDGNENAYRFEAAKGDFYRNACEQRVASLGLVAPENRAKYRGQLRAGFGLYLDSYVVNTNSQWYFGPVDGSRLTHYIRNLEQAASACDGYVWVYGEKYAWVPWKDTKNPRFTKTGTWDDALPGFTEEMIGIKDMQKAYTRKIAALKKADALINVFVDPSKWGKWQDDKKTQGKLTREGATVTLTGCGSGCYIAYVDGVRPGERYAVQFRVKGNGHSTVYWQRNRKWDWSLPGVAAVIDEADATGWALGRVLVCVPVGADRLAAQLGAQLAPNETVSFKDVSAYRLK